GHVGGLVDVLSDDLVVVRDALDVLGTPIQLHVDVGDQPTERRGAGDRTTVDLAVVRLVGVTGDEQVHRLGRTTHDVGDRAGHALAVVDPAFVVLRAALVQHHHDRLDAVLTPQLLGVLVGGLRFVEEVQVRDPTGADDLRGAL